MTLAGGPGDRCGASVRFQGFGVGEPGPVVTGVHVTDDLHLQHVHVQGPLNARGAQVGGRLIADHLTAHGLHLTGACVHGQITLNSARLDVDRASPEQRALDAEGLCGIVLRRLISVRA
jgi:hypothetical protein